MNRSIIWIVLATSVAFNLFFAASYVSASSSSPAPNDRRPAATPGDSVDGGDRSGGSARGDSRPRGGSRHESRRDRGNREMLRRAADFLGLDTDQQVLFETLHAGTELDDAAFEVAIQDVRTQLLAAYASESPDAETISSFHERELELSAARRTARAERFEAFMLALRPDQVDRFRTLIERMGRGGRESAMRRELAEYDIDGDGSMDTAEMEAFRAELNRKIGDRARRSVERRQAEIAAIDTDGDGRLSREERRAAFERRMLEQFDRNGDGVLDEDEQAAASEARAQMRRRAEEWRRHRGDSGGEARRGSRGPGDVRRDRPRDGAADARPATKPRPGSDPRPGGRP